MLRMFGDTENGVEYWQWEGTKPGHLPRKKNSRIFFMRLHKNRERGWQKKRYQTSL